MQWSASRVRRRLRIPGHEPLLAWARVDEEGMQVPFPVGRGARSRPSILALTDEALWVSRAGVSERFGLRRVVMASLVDDPDGAIRVDFQTGEPLVALVRDGGSFFHRLVREIRAVERELQDEALAARHAADRTWAVRVDRRAGHPAVSPTGADGVDGPGAGVAHYPDDVRAVLHEAQLIAVRELRTLLAELAASPGDPPGR